MRPVRIPWGRATRPRALAAVGSALVLALGACGGDDEQAANNGGGDAAASADPWLLGTPLGFTGALAAYAPSQKQGIELGVETVNENPPAGRSIEIVERDTKSEEPVAITTFEELVRQEQVHAIIGPTSSAEMFAAGPVADEAGVPAIGPANTAAGIPDIGECIFRVSAEETHIIPGAVSAAVQELDVASAGVIYASSDEFNTTGGKTFESTFEEEGVEVTGSATFSTGDTNFQAQLTELLRSEPDALAVAAYTPEAILVVRQARRLGYEGLIIGNKGFSGSGVIDEVGDAAGTLIVGAQYHPEAPTTGNEEFVAAFEEKYGNQPDEFSALAYDAVRYLAAGLEAAGADAGRGDVCEAQKTVKNLDGVTGQLQFTENGDVQTEGVALISEDGAPFELLGGAAE